MSLYVYRKVEDIPIYTTFIEINDAFFDLECSLRNDDFTNLVLHKIEKAEYASENSFYSRTSRTKEVYIDNLSTGSKILLNIYYHPDKCFSAIEAGPNVLRLFRKIPNGQVYWTTPAVSCYQNNDDCDIIMEGIHYTSFEKFIKKCMSEKNSSY